MGMDMSYRRAYSGPSSIEEGEQWTGSTAYGVQFSFYTETWIYGPKLRQEVHHCQHGSRMG